MSAIYNAIPTTAGQARIANALALGIPLKITHMAVGDGNGQAVTPNPAQTALVREKRRAPLNTLFQDPLNQSQLVAEQIIPEDVGDWWIREVGLYDDSGTLIAIANCPDTYKPLLSSGAGRTQTIRMVLIVSDTSAVALKIDPAVVLATRKYVDDVMKAHKEGRAHPDASETEKGFSRHATKEEVTGNQASEAVITVKALWEWAEGDAGISRTRQILSGFNGDLTPNPSWSPVPSHNDPTVGDAMDKQAQALLNRQEKFRQDLASAGGASMMGAGTGETQEEVNARLASEIANVSAAGAITDFGYWALSASSTTPLTGEVSFPTGYVATSNSMTFHQTDKSGRDMDGILALLIEGSNITLLGKINSAKRTTLRISSVTTTATTATVNYSMVHHTGANVTVGEEYKVLFSLPSSEAGYLSPAPSTNGPYVQNGGLWEKIKSYELGRAMFTVTGSSFSFKKNQDNSLSVSWSQLRLYNGLPGVTSVQDVVNMSVPVGTALYIDVGLATPYAVYSGAISDIVVDAVFGKKIILVGNYISGYAFGALAQRLLTASNNKNTRRVVSGTISSAVLSGADYTISTGVGRSYVEQNNGAHEYEIAPVTDVVVSPGQGLVVDFTNSAKNGSDQCIPVVESIASNATPGWLSADKYILFGSTGKSGATFGEYRFARAGVTDDTKIVIQKSTETFMNIIMKPTQNGSDKYVRYHMDRRIDATSRSDVWRINTVHEVIWASDLGFVTGTEICSSGEFECAVQEVGKSDYMGGWRHGDDQLVSVTMLVDGQVMDPAFIGNFKCSRFEVIQRSELLEVDNPTRTVRANAYRRWVYEDGKLELFNHVVFAAALNLKITFFNMFPIHRLAPDNTTLITGTAFRSPLYEPEDVSVVGFPIIQTKSNIIKYAGPNGWAGEVEVVDGWDKPGRNTWIQNSEEYNKGYFDYTGENYPVAAGDTLSGRAVYRIFDAN